MEPEGYRHATAGRLIHDEMRDLVAGDRLGSVTPAPVDRDDRGRDEDALLERRRFHTEHLLEADVETRLGGEDIDVQPVPERTAE